MRTSEARKRAEEADAVWVCQQCDLAALQCERCARAVDAWRRERAREVLRAALVEVWSGADFTDTDCVLDHLSDAGARLVVDQ